jgi:hemoglobin
VTVAIATSVAANPAFGCAEGWNAAIYPFGTMVAPIPAMTEPEQSMPTYFSMIGGAPAVDRLVESFYARMDTFAGARAIRAMHDADLAPTKAILKAYLGEWLGGPTLYSQKRGHPRLRMRHTRFAIGPAERDAWMTCMKGALAETIADDAIRGQIEQKLYQLADWVRNDEDNPHDRHH